MNMPNKLYLYKRYKTIPFNHKNFNLTLNNNLIDFDIDRLLNKIKDKAKINNIISVLAITLFFSFNPTHSFAISSLEILKSNGLILVNKASHFLINGIIIVTVLRLSYEYFHGANECRIFDILKECVGVILLLLLLPRIPNIFSLLLMK